jgi:hypothetical protein
MRIKREIQMGAWGGGQSITASGHWPREQAGHKPATGMTVSEAKNALDPRRAFSNRGAVVKKDLNVSPARVTVLSAVSRSCRNIWSVPEARALQGPQRAYA